MDERSFDQLTRVVGAARSRRRLLRTLAGGALGAVAVAVGFGEASAAQKRSVGNSCNGNSDCASGLCVQESRTRKICHCSSPADCPASTDQCRPAACLPNGYCGTPITIGAPCVDGNNCTTGDVCQENGTCAGTAVDCSAQTGPCTAGVCNASTGACEAQAANEGGGCDSGGGAGSGACQSGVCVTTTCPTTICSGACVDLMTDEANCGACGHACTSGGACLDGACFLAYPACGGSYGVAANGGGVNPCICGGGSQQVCATSSACASGEVCILIPNGGGGYTGYCFTGCPAG